MKNERPPSEAEIRKALKVRIWQFWLRDVDRKGDGPRATYWRAVYQVDWADHDGFAAGVTE